MESLEINLTPFLDEQGRVVQLPKKQLKRKAVLAYLAEKFEQGRIYTEKEVNAICEDWHTFQDYFLIRRSLVDGGFLRREKDGSAYWRNPETPE